MGTYSILALTDHAQHSISNSLYPLLKSLHKDESYAKIDVASRSILKNKAFFQSQDPGQLWASSVNQSFSFSEQGDAFKDLHLVNPKSYDVILLRLPHPVGNAFLDFLDVQFSDQIIINKPSGIRTISDKAFLLNYPALCPPMTLCQNADQILAFAKRFPIVLKPLRSYGGKGIVRIKNGMADWDGKQMTIFNFLKEESFDYPYLGMKYLKNVKEGDKRIVIVNGVVLGASLRMPPPDSWLCNVSQGGSAHPTSLSTEESNIVEQLSPVLIKHGIVMAGLDTLTDDNGKRVLSEINALSVGGLNDLANSTASDHAAQLISKYIIDHLS